MTMLNHEERLSILVQASTAFNKGDEKESGKILRQIPLAPHLAKAAKEMWGKDFLLQNGYDLSEAEVRYGKDWLNG